MYGKQLIATPKKYIEEQFTIMFVGFTAFLHLFWGRWGYVLIYFSRGQLPWQGFQAATKEEKCLAKNGMTASMKISWEYVMIFQGICKQAVWYVSHDMLEMLMIWYDSIDGV